MRSSLIRSRLRQDKAARLTIMYYPAAMMPVHAVNAGFDGIWIDTEHNTWDRREIQRMLALHHLAGIDSVVRTGSRNPAELYHLLEDGATGLMIPLVHSPEDARALAQAVKFPPVGQRGLDGAGIDNQFYLNGTKDYPAAANEETLLILQIESPEALARIDEIAGIKGVDGLFFGPGDLALRLNCPMDWTHPKMKEAEALVAAAAAKHKIAWGRPTRSAEDIADLAGKGARLMAHGSDFWALATMLPTYGKILADGLGQR